MVDLSDLWETGGSRLAEGSPPPFPFFKQGRVRAKTGHMPFSEQEESDSAPETRESCSGAFL